MLFLCLSKKEMGKLKRLILKNAVLYMVNKTFREPRTSTMDLTDMYLYIQHKDYTEMPKSSHH